MKSMLSDKRVMLSNHFKSSCRKARFDILIFNTYFSEKKKWIEML